MDLLQPLRAELLEAQVQRLYDIALANGGSDEGPPGPRGDDYYGAYFRDLDGNKLNFHCWT